MDAEKIVFDIDWVRVKDILAESYRGCADILGIDAYNITIEDFVSKINIYMNSNRVSIPVRIPLPSRLYPELHIEVDLRRRKVFARMASRKKQALINHFLKTL